MRTHTEKEEASAEEQKESSAVIDCISCGKRYFGLSVCEVCGNSCHFYTSCSVVNEDADVPVPCSIGKRNRSIHIEQMKSNIEQRKRAKKVMDNSVRRFKPAHVGDSVMVLVPLVDRGRAEFTNVKAVVFFRHWTMARTSLGQSMACLNRSTLVTNLLNV